MCLSQFLEGFFPLKYLLENCCRLVYGMVYHVVVDFVKKKPIL